MAKTRAQRKAERRKREQQQQRGVTESRDAESRAQHDTQVPESADVIEAELVERTGASPEELTEAPEELVRQTDVLGQELPAPAPSRADTVKEQRRREKADEKERRRREKEEQKAAAERKKARAAARKPAEPAEERRRNVVFAFFASCWAELKRVQWPDRETLVQASAVTIIFISVAAAYLGVLDAAFNWMIKRIL